MLLLEGEVASSESGNKRKVVNNSRRGKIKLWGLARIVRHEARCKWFFDDKGEVLGVA